MPLRFLVGPVATTWIEEFLKPQRESNDVLGFDLQAPADVVIQSADSWEEAQAQFPDGWQPDAIVLYLQYRLIPPSIWSARVPIIALAGDWNLQWHAYRRVLRHCDLILTDPVGVEVMQREGIEHVRAANLYGLEQSWIDYSWPGTKRDIDVLFVGNFNPAVQRERLASIARLAELRPKWNVVLASNVHGDEYRALMARSRIAFNRSIRREWNMRSGEAVVAGALLFQERGNREVPVLLKDREECVLYDDENLLDLLSYYLEHEDERARITANARRRIPEISFAHFWDAQAALIAEELPMLQQRAEARRSAKPAPDLRTRAWAQMSATFGSDPSLATDVKLALEQSPRNSHLYNAAGILAATGGSPATTEAAAAFQQAWQSDPRHVVAGLNLAEILAIMGQRGFANEQAQRTLAMLDQFDLGDTDFLDAARVRRFSRRMGTRRMGECGTAARGGAGENRFVALAASSPAGRPERRRCSRLHCVRHST
jgi:Glycosyl transferases group 1